MKALEKAKTKRDIVRVGGKLRELVTIRDETGAVLHKVLSPLMIEFYPRDVFQVIVGATLLAIPVAFTEETWNLGQSLAIQNIIGLFALSIGFIALFVYYNYYQKRIRSHGKEFLKRVVSTYLFSFLVVALILTLIERAPWSVDALLALKRTIIVALPASMSAAVADMIK